MSGNLEQALDSFPTSFKFWLKKVAQSQLACSSAPSSTPPSEKFKLDGES